VKRLTIKTFKPALTVLLMVIIAFAASAQKLPTVQQVSLRAPVDIKIDGKATEWNNKFQAYNHSTDLFYTISNDDDNLYLAVQSPEQDIIKRILNGSITFTVNPAGKKSYTNAISITYPVFSILTFVNFDMQPKIIQGSQISVNKADSFMNVTNKRMTDRITSIKVIGIKTLDTIISVYNEDGIKAASLFDNKIVYTWEMAVSLKNLGMSTANPVKFAYNVRINEIAPTWKPTVTEGPGGMKTMNFIGGLKSSPNPQYATDFWGEYILAKK